jgi:type I restriction enzyme S subunit
LVPPLPEQRRIITKLEDLLARSRWAKEALDAIPPLLERLRHSVLAAAFRGDLTADWREKNPDVEPAEKLLARIRVERRGKWEQAELAKMTAKGKAPTDDRWKERYVEPEPVDASRLPELPEGWCWAGLSTLAEVQLGQQRAPEHTDAEVTLPYIRAANITWDGLDLTDVKRMGFPDPARYRLEVGDVLLSEASGSASEVGKPVIWRGEIPDCCYQKTLLRLRPEGAGLSEWLFHACLHDAVVGKFAAMAPGVGILHLTAERMLGWPVPLAPVKEQAVVVARLRAALRHVLACERSHADLVAGSNRLDRAILAKAFRGELVPQDPNDEPAEVMLARLKAETQDGGAQAPSRRRKGGAT